MRVLIVGGAALVGMQLALALSRAGAVVIEDRPESPPHTSEIFVARRPPVVEPGINRTPNGPQPNNRKGRRYDRHR